MLWLNGNQPRCVCADITRQAPHNSIPPLTHQIAPIPDSTGFGLRSFYKMDMNNYENMRLMNSIRRGTRFKNWMEETIQPLRIEDDRRRQLMALLGIDGHCARLPASDITARSQAMRIFYSVVDEYMRYNVPIDTPKLLGTWTCDTGLTTDDRPHLRLNAFKAKTYQQIRTTGLHAIGVVEIQPITNYPFQDTNTFTMHAHGIAWGHTPGPARRAAVRKTNQSRAWSNRLEADPVQLKMPVRTEGGILGWGCYMWDNPDYAKRVRCWRNGKTSLANHVKTYPAGLALRLLEGLSYYSLPNLAFSVRDGKYLRRQWEKELCAWGSARDTLIDPEPEFDIAAAWENLPSAYYRRHSYQAFTIN